MYNFLPIWEEVFLEKSKNVFAGSGLENIHLMKEVSECIKQLSTLGKTQFVITHDPELVAGCCDYFIFIEDGLLKKYGEWNQENIDFVTGFFNQQ